MKILKSKSMAILIAAVLMISMGASMILIPNANAHTPAWNIPTYAYIVAAPNPIGVGQTIQVYMWLDCLYGEVGGSTAAIPTNGATASAALLSNDYRFHDYNFTIVAPDGTATSTIFAVVSDPTSNQETSFTPTTVGTYQLIFTFPGQVYGANGDGYSGSTEINDTYLPSHATTTLVVQQTPIPAALGSSPLPTAFWESPVYGENTIWSTISSNWLGSGSPVPAYYTSSTEYHGDAVGPLTSHIMWTAQLDFGGVSSGNPFYAGGEDPNNPSGVQYWEGSSYQPRFANPIIIDGYLYYTEPVSFSGGMNGPTVCVNLMTGQQLWSSTKIPPLSFGYVYNLWDPDQHGVFPPLLFASIGGGLTGIPSMWEVFDAYTGDVLFNVTGVPTGTAVSGPSGEQLRLAFTNLGTTASPNYYLSEWNSSKLWQYDINPYTGGGSLSPALVNGTNGVLIGGAVQTGSSAGGGPIFSIVGTTGTTVSGGSVFIPQGATVIVNASIPIDDKQTFQGSTTPIGSINYDSLTTYDWNISLGSTFNTLALGGTPTIVAADPGDMLLCRVGSLPTGFASTNTGTVQTPYTMFGINLNSSVGAIGSILWQKTYQPPPGNITLVMGSVDWQTRVWVMSYEETMQWEAFSLTNGAQLWGPIASQPAFDYYGNPGTTTLISNLAYGNLYSMSFSGICYCYNDQTGAVEWTYGNGPPGSDNSTNAGLNVFYGDYPSQIQSIADGVVYIATNEHTVPNPIYKGATTAALNATTGQLIWSLSDYPSEWSTPGTAYVVADGYAAFMNGYNNQVYSVGKGPSKTTVAAPDIGVTTDTPVTITGTVMDVSAGTTQSQQAADFPNGVPCASDASMGAWMGYVYQQQPEPTNFTGVPVQISVLDSNGNHYVIGTATTDQNGFYRLTWTPDITGNYTVYANFLGTNGYWPSSAEAAFYAGSPAATPPPTATPLSGLASNTTVMYGIVAIAIIIIVIGAVLAVLVTRKHP